MTDKSLMQITEEEEQKMIARSRKKYEWDRVAWMKVEMDEARAEGRAEGWAESRVESIRNVMDGLNISIEQAMNALKIPAADHPKYREMIPLQ